MSPVLQLATARLGFLLDMSDLWTVMAEKFDVHELRERGCVPYSQFRLLLAVVKEHPALAGMSRYAALIGRDAEHTRRLMNRLISKGWVRRVPILGRPGRFDYVPNITRIIGACQVDRPERWRLWVDERCKAELWKQDGMEMDLDIAIRLIGDAPRVKIMGYRVGHTGGLDVLYNREGQDPKDVPAREYLICDTGTAKVTLDECGIPDSISICGSEEFEELESKPEPRKENP